LLVKLILLNKLITCQLFEIGENFISNISVKSLLYLVKESLIEV